MTTVSGHEGLSGALRACASGIYHLEAGTSLLIDSACWLHREDFTSRFIDVEADHSGRALAAAVDWEAAINALNAGQLPCSSGERHVLRLSASIAAGIPVSLSDTLPGIDARNAALVTRAVAHATGIRP